MKNKKVLIIIMSCILILTMQFFASKFFSDYVGTDDQSVEIIQEIAPQYEPWASNIFEFENSWSENLMFAFQATIGLSIISFYLIKQSKENI